MRELNLARQPFVNVKPVRRAGLLLFLAALGLLVLNALLYWDYFTGESQTRSKSQELTRKIEEEEAEVERLRRRISALDIDGLNRRTRFVNLEIDRRRFAWSRLFDRLAQVQPGAVRLVNMTPQFGEESRSRSRRSVAADEVIVDLRGVAQNGEAILEFVDGLFQHPAFRAPDLIREGLRDDGMSGFTLSVVYLPNVEEAPVGPAEEGDGVQEAVVDAEEEETA